MARRMFAPWLQSQRCTGTPPWEWRWAHAGVSRISRRHPSSARACSFWPRFADRVRPLCESLGVSRVTRIIRVRLRMILEEENAAQTSDEMALSLDWLMPEFRNLLRNTLHLHFNHQTSSQAQGTGRSRKSTLIRHEGLSWNPKTESDRRRWSNCAYDGRVFSDEREEIYENDRQKLDDHRAVESMTEANVIIRGLGTSSFFF